MTSFLDGFRLGQGIVDSGYEERDRARSYRGGIAKAAEDTSEFNRHQSEIERHDKAVEGEWAPGSRGARGGSGMSDAARKSIARGKIIADHTRKLAASIDETPEEMAAYRSALDDEHEYLHPGQPLPKKKDETAEAPAPSAGFGFDWDSAFKVPLENAEKFFQAHSVPAPAPQTMTGTLNGKRVTLTKTAAGWTDESGQVVK